MIPVPERKSYEREERIAIVAEGCKIGQVEAEKLVKKWESENGNVKGLSQV